MKGNMRMNELNKRKWNAFLYLRKKGHKIGVDWYVNDDAAYLCLWLKEKHGYYLETIYFRGNPDYEIE